MTTSLPNPPSSCPNSGPSGRKSLLSGFVSFAAFCSLFSLAPAQEPVADTPVAKIPIDTTPIVEAPINEADRQHWAFAPIKRQPLPEVKAKEWPKTGVDTFIRAKLEAKEIAPQSEAPRATLLRRL